MAEGVLEREFVVSPAWHGCASVGWVDVEAGSTSPFAANISNYLACEMSFAAGTREDESLRIAAAQLLKKAERYRRCADSACLKPFAEEVNLASVIEYLDVFPTDNRDLGDSATQEKRALKEDT